MIQRYHHIAQILLTACRHAAQVLAMAQVLWESGHVILHTEQVRHQAKKPEKLKACQI